MALSGVETVTLHVKSPWMPMWWSAALPGLGHFCQGHYYKGLILLFWETLINYKASLNLAIMYTFTGQFSRASETIDPAWILLYGVVFSFAIFDAYRIAVEQNVLARLEKKQTQRSYQLVSLSSLSINYLQRSNPWIALVWSALFTGFGHLYNKKTIKAAMLVIWMVAIIHLSNVSNSIIATFVGDFDLAHKSVDYQWLLFFPSIYTFAIWDSYNDAVEMNLLFADAQKDYLQRKYGRGQDYHPERSED